MRILTQIKPHKVILWLILFLSLPFTINAQNISSHPKEHYIQTADSIVRYALKNQTGYNWLSELCKIGPRLSGSDESINAIFWAEEKLKSLGCDSVWLQPVMVPHWIRGNTEKAYISKSKIYKGKELAIGSLGRSIGTGEKGITAQVIEVYNFDELKKLGDKTKGKIIFFNRPFDETIVNTFGGYGNAVDQRFGGPIEAAKVGGVAVLIRSITSKYDNVPHVGVIGQVDSVKQIPAAAIGLIDADFLSSALKKDPDLQLTLKMDCANLPENQSYNVIGEIRGSEFPNEIIVVGGHFDSWDKGCGVHDDGAPCLQTMEVINLFKKLDIWPKRTIRCVLFINEENGTRGGTEYAAYADSTKESHVAAIESDRGAFTPRGFTVMADSLVIEKIQSWLPILNLSLIDYVRRGYGGVDINQIRNIKALIGYDPDNQRYMDVHHSANDTFESIHPREMELGSAAIAILTYLISEEGL